MTTLRRLLRFLLDQLFGLLALAGVALVVAGLWQVHPPSALIFAGVVMLLTGLLGSFANGTA